MWQRASSGSGGGGGNPLYMDFTISELINATDANPIIINGDFSDIVSLAFCGYTYSEAGQYKKYNTNVVDTFTFGTTFYCKFTNAWGTTVPARKVTIYTDKIVIGSGGYFTGSRWAATDSTYGLPIHIALFKNDQ